MTQTAKEVCTHDNYVTSEFARDYRGEMGDLLPISENCKDCGANIKKLNLIDGRLIRQQTLDNMDTL